MTRSTKGWRPGPGALATAVMTCLALAACGGGGGGDDSSAMPQALGLVKLTVKDSFGAPVAGVTVQGPQGSSTTDAQGSALVLTSGPDVSANVTLSRPSFVDRAATISSSTGKVNELDVTLERATAPAGGSLSTRNGLPPSVDGSGQQLTFEIELVVVQGDSRPVENLTAADFVLRPCTPDAATTRIDCVRAVGSDLDIAYTPGSATPEAATPVPGLAARPYAAALLLDQSGSIQQSDPTGARLYASKAFLTGLGAEDQALLAAFASGPDALIPTRPLTVYGSFKDRAAAPPSSYYPTLDGLAPLVGGNTPLYESLDGLLAQVAGDTALPASLARAMVVFTDGADTSCSGPEACRSARERSVLAANQAGLRIFTIGLSQDVDVAALGELANQTGGAFLYADTVQQFLPLYGSVGRLLSLSQPTYRLRWTVQAASAGTFRPGAALLGKVQVNVGGNRFDVPFIVGIP
jgi:hypothetical protein